ncbi:hypothetical protein Jden_0644 [Jonesia denitrificans DSM 20603]|uniref:Uncharacterized protein n=1 Tax=Jonesia denitrificans (strain ATCC 14870 / DSM 20603 / BCRC 15368 / CIP 55.134 / JCM 11481 / NBRC 15587 / NCTC 10816 / Prevot 55134) TaxID=471856 RepID=C7R193_JONDD|nr:hypothetical protein Jden_0644 [Jonesia denitrificans DSM 20603]
MSLVTPKAEATSCDDAAAYGPRRRTHLFVHYAVKDWALRTTARIKLGERDYSGGDIGHLGSIWPGLWHICFGIALVGAIPGWGER